MNSSLNEELFFEVSKYLDAIIENAIVFLHQFYIAVAKYFNSEEYD